MKYFFSILALVILFSCNNSDNTPDVSGIKVDLNTKRFEQELFKLDSANFTAN
jgi:hypothetical protein